MALRGHDWFGSAHLLPGEQFIRVSRSRLRTDSAPYWWEGDLVLTSDRLMFLSYTENPLLRRTAFWLADVAAVAAAGRNRLAVRVGGGETIFHIIGNSLEPRGLAGLRARGWIADIDRLHSSRPLPDLGDTTPRRQAG